MIRQLENYIFTSSGSIFICSLGYVEEIKQVLFSIIKEERESIRDRYKAKVPEPLSNQFPERASKDEAIMRHTQRKQTSTELFPSGKIIINVHVLE